MTTKVKKIKALLGLKGTSDPDVLKLLNAAHDGINGNLAFPAPPFDIATFKAGIDKFTVLVTDAEDGGKKAIARKRSNVRRWSSSTRCWGTTLRRSRTMIWRCSTPADSSWLP